MRRLIATLLLVPALFVPLVAQTQPQTQAQKRVDVRFIALAPSPYTGRHDSMRAGFGILTLLDKLVADDSLPIQVRYYDRVPALESQEKSQEQTHPSVKVEDV